jgi:hypothetical protein
MQTKQFWELIEASNQQKNTIDKNDQGDALLEILTKFDKDKILGFHLKLAELKKELNTPFFNDIAFMMKYGDNRIALSGFKNWVIALGEEHYEKTKKSPPHLLTLDDSKLFVAGRAYLNELDCIPKVAYEDIAKEDDLDWYEFEQKHRRLEQIKKNQNQDKEKDQELER